MSEVEKTPVNVVFCEWRKVYAVTTTDLARFGSTLEQSIAAYCKAENATHRGHAFFNDCNYIFFEDND